MSILKQYTRTILELDGTQRSSLFGAHHNSPSAMVAFGWLVLPQSPVVTFLAEHLRNFLPVVEYVHSALLCASTPFTVSAAEQTHSKETSFRVFNAIALSTAYAWLQDKTIFKSCSRSQRYTRWHMTPFANRLALVGCLAASWIQTLRIRTVSPRIECGSLSSPQPRIATLIWHRLPTNDFWLVVWLLLGSNSMQSNRIKVAALVRKTRGSICAETSLPTLNPIAPLIASPFSLSVLTNWRLLNDILLERQFWIFRWSAYTSSNRIESNGTQLNAAYLLIFPANRTTNQWS